MLNTVGEEIKLASTELAELTDTPRLDAEVLLSYVIGKPRVFFMTWPDHQLTSIQQAQFEALVQQRKQGVPVAYLTGEREFWSLPLKTSPETLIPRPDTEVVVETVLQLASELPIKSRVLDLGTGTGAIALAIASEKPDWSVCGVDVATACVELAQLNLAHLGFSNCRFLQSDWYDSVEKECFDIIVSNPPYIEEDDPHLNEGDVRFEPKRALVAADNGLADIRHIVAQSVEHLATNGWLLVEHGYKQAELVQESFTLHGFNKVETIVDYGQQPRVTIGCFSGKKSLNL